MIDLSEYVEKLYSAAVRKTGDSYFAEEIMQETLLAALQNINKGINPENVWAWLLRILSNKYCDALRIKYDKPYISYYDYPFELQEPASTFDDDYNNKLEAIRYELGYLAKKHREVLISFYMHGKSIEKIAKEMDIPVGTIKSRLNMGREYIKKGVKIMDKYIKQSYEPDILQISCSGGVGLKGEPFSLVEYNDKIAQNILLFAYEKPVTETEIAKALGIPSAFIEPIVEKMLNGELMSRTDSKKVYTNFIIYADEDRKSTFEQQLLTSKTHFDSFWMGTENALNSLRAMEFYKRQNKRAQKKLELHFCIDVLMWSCISIRNEITGLIPYSDYPYRKNGGRWIAMGHRYPSDYNYKQDGQYWKYAINGEAGTDMKNFRNSRFISLRRYGTEFGHFPENPTGVTGAEYVKWLYEIIHDVPVEQSSVSFGVLDSSEALIKNGFLKKDASLSVDIPILTSEEYQKEKTLSQEYQTKINMSIRDEMLKLFANGYVRLPKHLKDVPKWQQYMHCGDSVPMAVIYQAIERGLFLQEINYPLPAAILVIDE